MHVFKLTTVALIGVLVTTVAEGREVEPRGGMMPVERGFSNSDTLSQSESEGEFRMTEAELAALSDAVSPGEVAHVPQTRESPDCQAVKSVICIKDGGLVSGWSNDRPDRH